MINTYASAADYLGRKIDRPLSGRSTRLQRRDDDTIAVRYHYTDVVTYHADGPTVLYSGGYHTMTTKSRMNEYTQANVVQANGVWYLVDRPYGGSWRSLFEDPVSIDDTGKPTAMVDAAQYEKAKRAIDRKVAKYIKGFMAHLSESGKMPEPSGGDCWPCLMRPKDDSSDTHVDAMGTAHYICHFDDAYYVPSLLVNAMRERRFGSLSHVWSMASLDLSRGEDPWSVRSALQAFFRARKHDLVGQLI